MSIKRRVASLTAFIIVVFCLISGCTGSGKQRPMLSLMSDEELKNALNELSVPVCLFAPDETESNELWMKRRTIRLLEFDIDYMTDYEYEGEMEQDPYEVLRRAVKEYYGGDLPVIKNYAVRGRPACEASKKKLSELGDEELIRTLMEHYFTYEPHCAVSTEDIRAMTAALEAEPDRAAEEVFQNEEISREMEQDPHFVYPKAYRCMIEELRRAVKLYYGLSDADAVGSGITDNKTPLSALEDSRLVALLAELGVLMDDIPESLIPEVRRCIEFTEEHMHGNAMASEDMRLTYLYEEIYRAVHIYHSERFPLGGR